ncbi:hypothetical protein ASPWEDRAFT_47574 [Aspergillus wentii DTO 134E9]|uniref:Gfo/Idh/MocA-like oxidoreductase N-terminal domain-containing protein n=1 Tax=Aspergillus wentii DTO 134E9 TaxID=1073089 RepID=A0A1L9S101_ASPWE|nr:uncharacterized protein ASPWEDRAFT_47574 [Aspergillus wentii DTO 134E9]OJJ40845.1 hypothetical protein ASPWEDRAFT_47574 [Aspergillus wentii DTO 134E9]
MQIYSSYESSRFSHERCWSIKDPPRLILVGAGSRGTSLARAVVHATNGHLAAVADPNPYRRRQLGRQYIWGVESAKEGEEFTDWVEFREWEVERRKRESAGENVGKGVDGVVVCVMDSLHREVLEGLAPLGLHVMCEKPLATSLDDCVGIYESVLGEKSVLFAIGHVMRYSPQNMLLKKLVEDEAVGDVVSIEHTENVGWWHFAHSYVRGNWRKTSTSGPTLLTKSCHDIDFLMWLMCNSQRNKQPHLPSTVASFGSLRQFRRARKPVEAGNATNCMSCPIENSCHYSAQKIYWEQGIMAGLGGWPVDVVVPDIEDLLDEGGLKGAREGLNRKLAEDYTEDTPAAEVEGRQWYGRCVFESDNDVCDDQTVNINWDDDPLPNAGLKGRGMKSATFHMTAFTQGVCTKRTRVFGTKGEIEASGKSVKVHDFISGETKEHPPMLTAGGHSGGDHGLMAQFVLAIDAIKNKSMSIEEAQNQYIGCTPADIFRSHAMVFAAEDARTTRRIVDWNEWWKDNVKSESLR